MAAIKSHCPGVKPEKLELFLFALSRKGFLEYQGYPEVVKKPFVSIIVPVHNRPLEIKTCLESLMNIDYPSDCHEVIVVDDASSDVTPEVIKSYNVRLITLTQNRKAAFCRNLGAAHAKGEILAFIDSDCSADPDWLNRLVPSFNDNEVGIVGGKIDSYFTTSGLDRYEQVKSSLIIGNQIKRSRDVNSAFYVPSCNLLIRKILFQKVGGFNRHLVVGEDVDLCWRIQDNGFKVEFRPEGVIFHRHRNKIKAFCKRRFEYGTSEPMLQTLHRNREKQFYLPLGGLVFLLIAALAAFKPASSLWILCPICFVTDLLVQHARLKAQHIPVKLFQQAKAILRTYASILYHVISFFSRYYLIISFLFLLILPKTAAVLFSLHLLVGMIGWKIQKPALDPVSFLFYFSLEQISYQSGVWAGVFKQRKLSPVNPVVTFRR
jgi:mycofactocin system glycosyltransferase